MEKQLFVNYRDASSLLTLAGKAVLVGSSGRVLLRSHGSELDSYDLLFRMNTAPTQKFEHFVGTRTDARVVAFNATKLIFSDPSLMKGTKYIFVWGSQDKLIGCHQTIQEAMKLYPDTQFYMMTPYAYQLISTEYEKESGVKIGGGNWLSTGIVAIFIMRHLFGSFDMYGFGDFKGDGSGAKLPYHYWKDHTSNQSEQAHTMMNQMGQAGHRFMTEKMVILKWMRDSKINFV